MFLTIVGCVKTALAASQAQTSTGVDENARYFAFLLLRAIDGDLEDGKGPFRIGRPDSIHMTPLTGNDDEDIRFFERHGYDGRVSHSSN